MKKFLSAVLLVMVFVPARCGSEVSAMKIFKKHDLSFEIKSVKGWLRLISNKESMKYHDIKLSDEEISVILLYLKKRR